MSKVYEDEHTYVWTLEEGDSPAVRAIKDRLRWSYEHNNSDCGYPWNEGASTMIALIDDVKRAEASELPQLSTLF
jgi:hypothetical protein